MRRRAAVAALVVVLALAAALALRLDVRDGGDGAAHPWEWDAQVEPVAEAVEELRGLEFRHPVFVDFLAEEEFRADVRTDEDDLSEEDAEELASWEGLLRATGLVEGDVDFLDALNATSESGIAAYYSPADERIRVRGEELTPGVELTLAHELVHALQDQHFDLEASTEAAEEDGDGASTAFQAVVEGDASRIESLYFARHLDDDEQDAAAEEARSSGRAFEDEAADVPAILPTLLAAPYPTGESLLALVTAEEGEEAIDDLYAEPPASEEHLLDPWTLVTDRDDPVVVDRPELGADEEELDSGELGSLGWLFLLAERVPLVTSLDAVDGWGGDAYVSFEAEGRTCVRVAHVADTAADSRQLERALTRWGAASPRQAVSVERDGDDSLVLDACEPPATVDVGADRSDEALGLALTRSYAGLDLLRSGLGAEQARCLADGLVHAFTVAEVNDPTSVLGDPAGQRTVRRLATACGADLP